MSWHGGVCAVIWRVWLPHWPFILGIWLGLVAALITTALRLWLITARGQDLGEYDGIDEQLEQDLRLK